MRCPKCAAEMSKVVYQEIEEDRCTGCHGLWFDMLEHEDLNKLAGSESIDTGSPDQGRAQDGKVRIQCPVCRVPMIHMVVAGQPHIGYEACTVCYGVYFDAGEFTDFHTETFAESWRSVFGKRPGPR